MNVLPPGTILQLEYLRERLRKVTPGQFIEIGPGAGETSSLLLNLGWKGVAYDLEMRTVERLKTRFPQEISEGRYDVSNQDFFTLTPDSINKVDLIISCMVMEHFNDEMESKFLQQSRELLNDHGLMIGLVPASQNHWGIEDEIAGHFRRYSRSSLNTLARNNDWEIQHISGLTYPISNMLLPVSNFLVKRAEASKLALPNIERTKASGIRKVQFKTNFPNIFALLLNRYSMRPFHWLQKALSFSKNSLILYFEARPNSYNASNP